MAEEVTVTIDRVAYRVRKLADGTIRVTHPGGQFNPMHGPDTGGVHAFDVSPVQVAWYDYWNRHLPPAERDRRGPEKPPWWSSKSWKKKAADAE